MSRGKHQNSGRANEQATRRTDQQNRRGSASTRADLADRSQAGPVSAGRELGRSQNFLTSRRLVEQLVERAEIGPGDLVLEIGPGRGIITEALASRARRVVAVEKDPTLAARLA